MGPVLPTTRSAPRSSTTTVERLAAAVPLLLDGLGSSVGELARATFSQVPMAEARALTSRTSTAPDAIWPIKGQASVLPDTVGPPVALTNVTLPYVLKLANSGARDALLDDIVLGRGANVVAGQVTNEDVAEATGIPYVELADALGEVVHA